MPNPPHGDDFANFSDDAPELILSEIRDNLAVINAYIKTTQPLINHYGAAQRPILRSNHDAVISAAVKINKSRRMRKKYFDTDLLGEPFWDIMLDLFIAENHNRSISITSACIASGVPPTTALRWLNVLMDAGWICRTEDDNDRRRSFVALTSKGKTAMTEYLKAAISE